MAKNWNINGFVNNSNDGVHIEFNASDEIATKFYRTVLDQAPALSKITHHSLFKVEQKQFDSFFIQESVTEEIVHLMLTPDYAMCVDCRKELHDKNNRRFNYPFITCTHCGPRYSIIKELPYDRKHTSMNDFEMCTHCMSEYEDPSSRRHYSQTNSCKECGINISMYSGNGTLTGIDEKDIVNTITSELNDGKIIALKGIGGYLLLCDASNEATVLNLRKRKHRPSKPYALLYPSIEYAENNFEISPEEKTALQSVEAPIVLLKIRDDSTNSGRKNESPKKLTETNRKLAKEAIAPGLSHLGIMLPYAPLLELVTQAFQHPLIATSANISGSPIIYSEEDALNHLKGIADFIVTHNREIITPQDDSVVKYTNQSKQKIILRRSRGLAPSFFGYTTQNNSTLLATGALLKSSFTYTNKGNTFISQYLGNTDSYLSQKAYSKTLGHFIQLFHKQPKVIISDKHPEYFSTQLAGELSQQFKIEVKKVQHHKAHAAAVLAENNLLQHETPVLCVIWDGTGLGDDGNIWGGEFFIYEKYSLARCYHFDYFPFILGDKMAKEPRISALSICRDNEEASGILQSKFTTTEFALYKKLLSGKNNLQCCSVGRIFDAVSSLLNLCDKQSYEGEAALLLETLALQYFISNGYNFIESYFTPEGIIGGISTDNLIKGLMEDILKGINADFIAAKFHYSLAHIISYIAEENKIDAIACSGGVFQNAVLVDLINFHLGKTYHLFFHNNLSPNDENISFGQMVYHDNDLDSKKVKEAGAAKTPEYRKEIGEIKELLDNIHVYRKN